jgi:SPX domain
MKKSRWRRRISTVSYPRSSYFRAETGFDDGQVTPPYSRYSQNIEPEISPGQHLPSPTPANFPSEKNSSGNVPTVDAAAQQRITSGSVGQIVQPGEGKYLTVHYNRPQINTRPMSETNQAPGLQSALSIELVSMTEDYKDAFSEAELEFLQWLDTEIKKVDNFYREKENVAAQRYKSISAQLDALSQLQDIHIPIDPKTTTERISIPDLSVLEKKYDFRPRWRRFISALHNGFHLSFDRLSSTMPAADHESRVKQPELMAKPITNTTGYVEYRVARRRLKQAVFEFYRSMELLKRYRLLNRVGLEKMLKKFDKTTGHKISGDFVTKLKSFHFEQSDELENLITDTEV